MPLQVSLHYPHQDEELERYDVVRSGNKINARKSWSLSDVTWMPAGTDSTLCWEKIVQRVGDNGSYNVDVRGQGNVGTLVDSLFI